MTYNQKHGSLGPHPRQKGRIIMRSYQVIKDGSQYTIGEWDEGYNAYIVNDGICNYYFWNKEEEAQAAADAYNAYDGQEWLGEHGNDNDRISEDEVGPLNLSDDMVALYKLFGAYDPA